MNRYWGTIGLVVALWVGMASTAAGESTGLDRAQKLFDDAQQAVLAGKLDDAATKFQAAYDAKPLPDLLYNIGAVYYLKGKQANDAGAYQLAVTHYRNYLRAVPDAGDKPKVEKAIEVIEQEIARITPPADAATPVAATAPSEEIRALDAKPRSLVVIETEPQGASIFLDDKANGVFAETPWSGTLDGPHKILIEKRGHKPQQKAIAPDPRRLVVLQVVLAEEDYLGWLEVRSNVPGASVFIDDDTIGARGKTPFSANLKPGKHTVWIRADGYDEVKTTVDVAAGKSHEVNATLKGAPVGYLEIRGAGLEQARLLVDGKVVCEHGPCRVPVAEGVRTVVIRRSGYKPYTVALDIQAHTETVIRPSLVETPSRTDAVVAYVFSALFAGGATAAYVYQGGIEPTEKLYDDRKYIRYGAYAGWGLAGVIGLSAVYYTFRDKGPPSTGDVNVALGPTIDRSFAGLAIAGRF